MTSVIAQHPRLRLAGAADPQPTLRKRFEGDFDLPTEADVAALAARPDIDALYIATPHQFHAEHADLAARRGKHVVVEKPMSLSLADLFRAEARAGTRSSHKAVINIFLGGGPPHQDMWEIKTEAPKEIRGPYVPIGLRSRSWARRPRAGSA